MVAPEITRTQRAALYGGGFLGPFAGLMTASILPELGASFGIAADAAAVSMMAYMLPFALTMLVSGHLGGRWGIRRMMTTAYAVFTVAGIGCALAPTWHLFLLGYMLMGISNAFTTPLILSVLGRVTDKKRLGRSLGLYAALAAMGQLSAPLFSGVLAQFSWKYAPLSVAVFALFLCVFGVPKVRHPVTQEPTCDRKAPTLSMRIVWICLTNLALGSCVTGLGFLIALFAYDSLDSAAAERGIILMAGGVASLALAPVWGVAVDRWGSHRVVVTCLAISACCTWFLPAAGAAAALAALWAGSIAAGQAVTVAINKHILGLPGSHSAISVVQSFRFFGAGLAPVIFMPIYLGDPAGSFQLAAGVLILAMMLTAVASPFGRGMDESALRA